MLDISNHTEIDNVLEYKQIKQFIFKGVYSEMINNIILTNSLVEVESKNKLSVEELFLYSYLWSERTFENRTKTSIDIMNEDVLLMKDKKENKKRVKEALNVLQDKELIVIKEKGKVLNIEFNVTNEDKQNGYVSVSYEKFRQLKPIEFYIYVATAKWKDGAKYSYSTWAKLLVLKERRTIDVITEAVEKNIIYKLEGAYQDAIVNGRTQKKQDMNIYSTMPFLISEKQETKKKKVISEKPQTQKPSKTSSKTQTSKLSEADFPNYAVGNWFEKYVKQTDLEEYFFRKGQAEQGDTTVIRFVEYCESRFPEWQNNRSEKVRGIFKDNYDKAEAKHKQNQSRKNWANMMADKHTAELNHEISYDREPELYEEQEESKWKETQHFEYNHNKKVG